jgi:hypothetical protein
VSVLLCIISLVVFPKTEDSELIIETSLNALTFTPRWSLEPYPGYQGFLTNKLRLSHAFLYGSDLSVGVEIGVANRFHFTYFESYAAWGVDDTKAWLMLNPFDKINFLARVGLPSGRYSSGIGIGAYSFEIFLKTVEIVGGSSAYIGYEWVGANPDEVDYGDNIHFGLELLSWFRIRCLYAFADQSAYFSLYDSPSFGIEISVSKNFTVLKFYNLALVLNQTVFGKDIPVKTGISLRISLLERGG